MSILKLNIFTSIIILIIYIIRFFYINKIPKVTFILLWNIAIVRLLLPFSISTRFSIYNILKNRSDSLSNHTNLDTLNVGKNLNLSDVTNYEYIKNNGNSINILNIVWIIGIVFLLGYFIYSYLKCIQEFKTALPVQNRFIDLWLKDLDTNRKITIMISDKISSPLTYGFIKPVILLPKCIDWDDIPKLTYILEHEFYHIKYFDTFYKVILTVVVAINWFNPFIWIMYNLVNRDIELTCDERVINKLGKNIRKSYAVSLIDFEERKSNSISFINNFNKNHMEERIVAIMKFKKVSILSTVLALTLVGGATTVFATDAKNYPTRQVESTVKDNNSEQILKDLFETYTVEEYQKMIENIEKYADGEGGDKDRALDKMYKNLEKLKQDNGKGNFVIYKSAFEEVLELTDEIMVTSGIDPAYIMDIETIKKDFTAKGYQKMIKTTTETVNRFLKKGEITKAQKQAILDKMNENLSLLK